MAGIMVNLKPFPSVEHFWSNLAESIKGQGRRSVYADVSIHCKFGTVFRANRIILASTSKLFRAVFQDHDAFADHDVLCPDFHPESMEVVLELLYTGSTTVDVSDRKLCNGVKSILECFGMDRLKEDVAAVLEFQSCGPAVLVVEGLLPIETLPSSSLPSTSTPVLAATTARGRKRGHKLIAKAISTPVALAPKLEPPMDNYPETGIASYGNDSFDNNDSATWEAPFPDIDDGKDHVVSLDKCYLCGVKQTNKWSYVRHLSVKHFRDEMKQFYGDKKWECGVCKFPFDGNTNYKTLVHFLH